MLAHVHWAKYDSIDRNVMFICTLKTSSISHGKSVAELNIELIPPEFQFSL